VPFLDPVPENSFEARAPTHRRRRCRPGGGASSSSTIRWRYAPRRPEPGQPHNKASFLRHQQSFWREFLEQFPEAFSIGNMLTIEVGLPPILDEVFTEFPGNEWMEGWLGAHLDHHHWDRGAWPPARCVHSHAH
jgi:hypothetical protein